MRLSKIITWLVVFSALTTIFSNTANAQTIRSTTVNSGQTVDIDVHGDCKRVTFSGFGGAGGVLAPWDTAAEWQNFYNNPPPGVSIASCAASCAGYSYGGYCYFWANGVTQSCDELCVGNGGSNAAGTRFIGSDDSGSSRCSAVATALVGSAVTASGTTGYTDGCTVSNLKGGWVGTNYYSPTTETATASVIGRICACGGSGTCAGPYNNSSTNRTYTATTLATNTFSLSQSANITVYGTTGACNPQPTYNHPHYIQVIRVSDGAVMAQGNNGGYTWFGACWTSNESNISVAVGPGTYTTRLISQQNCNDSNRCAWGYNVSMSCY